MTPVGRHQPPMDCNRGWPPCGRLLFDCGHRSPGTIRAARAGQSRHPLHGHLETDAGHLSTERLTARSLIDDPTAPCADGEKRFAQRPNDPRMVDAAGPPRRDRHLPLWRPRGLFTAGAPAAQETAGQISTTRTRNCAEPQRQVFGSRYAVSRRPPPDAGKSFSSIPASVGNTAAILPHEPALLSRPS